MNLAAANTYMHAFFEKLPEDIARAVDYVRMDRDLLGSSCDQLRQDVDLYDLEMRAAEDDKELFFSTRISSNLQLSENLKRSDKLPMSKAVFRMLDLNPTLATRYLICFMDIPEVEHFSCGRLNLSPWEPIQ